MIKAVLIDDERNALEMMEWLLKTYTPDVEVEASCTNAQQGMEAIGQYKPDVVFLDIEMPKMNGFEMLEKIGKISFDVVFCTAYDQFAIRAFRFSALNYLLKPVDPDDLKATVQRLREKRNIPSQEQFALLLQQMTLPQRSTPQRIALTTHEGLSLYPQRKYSTVKPTAIIPWWSWKAAGKSLYPAHSKTLMKHLPVLTFSAYIAHS
jgi:two-component system, LytTR family, response regulator